MDNPILHPGKCISCGCTNNEDGRKFLDLGVDLDVSPIYSTAIYICTLCLTEATRVAGIQTIITEEKIVTIETDQTEILSKIEGKLDELRDRFFSSSNIPTASGNSGSTNSRTEKGESDNTAVTESEQPVDEQNTSRRPPSVQSLTDLIGKPAGKLPTNPVSTPRRRK